MDLNSIRDYLTGPTPIIRNYPYIALRNQKCVDCGESIHRVINKDKNNKVFYFNIDTKPIESTTKGLVKTERYVGHECKTTLDLITITEMEYPQNIQEVMDNWRNSPRELLDDSTRESHVVFAPKNASIRSFLYQLADNVDRRAARKGLECNIYYSFIFDLYIKQRGRCALTGHPFVDHIDGPIKKGLMRPFYPSIDRIDSKKGYTEDNVRLVCVATNIALGEWGDRIFDEICIGRFNELVKIWEDN